MLKPKSCIWKFYEKVVNKDQKVRYKYNYCAETYTNFQILRISVRIKFSYVPAHKRVFMLQLRVA